jgi:hypothetical protein
VIRNEKADEWSRVIAEELDAKGVERQGYTDRYGKRPMPQPTSLANIKRETSGK